MTFKTTEKIDDFIKEHRAKCRPQGTAGEQFVFTFVPTSIVECQNVKCVCCGEELSDYID